MDQVDWKLIKSAPLFDGVPDEAVMRLIGNHSPKKYDKGAVLFQNGDVADAFYFILDGWVKIYRLSPVGSETVVGLFTRGESFAEAAMFLGGHYPVDAEIVSPSRLLCIHADTFRALVHEEPDLALAMLASCSKHLKFLVEQLEQIKLLSAPRRIADFLVGLCPANSSSCKITLPYEKSLIANRLGMQPESFSRAITKLRPLGVVVEREHVDIADVASLTQFAGRKDEEPEPNIH
jgi:CRP-like cAMP-binding protein